MSKSLFNWILVRRLLVFPALAAMLFLAAGTLRYWEAWMFIAMLVVCNLELTAYLIIHDPELLARRRRIGPAAETSAAQRVIVTLTFLVFIAGAVVSALDRRFGWTDVPVSFVLLGDALVVLAHAGLLRVFRANTYGAATIQVEAEQRVVSTGPYAVVRHPMYSAALILFLAMPLALGSWWGLVALAPGFCVFVWRLVDEERYLHRRLPGYTEYTQKVRWRLIPAIF